MKTLAAAALLALAVLSPAPQKAPASWLIAGARVADGTGGPIVAQDVRIEGERIAEVGKLQPRAGERVVKGEGLVLAPGFIDIHNHSEEGLASDPLAETQISQGITTLVLGPDGGSAWPIADYLKARREAPATVNVLTMVGHATVRKLAMGQDYKRFARPEEIAKMAALVEQGMREGAMGLSSGLEYEVGGYAKTEELIELCKAAARHGGFYMTHIRDEADHSFQAIAEAIYIAQKAALPLQISHIKLGTVGVWGKAPVVVKMLDQARTHGIDATADCYPYDAWHSDLYVLVPNRKYFDDKSVEKGLKDVGGAANVTITACPSHPGYGGRSLAAIAVSEGVTPVELFKRIIKDGGADVIGHSMKAEDIFVFYEQPWVMVASDGGIENDHPRGAGTFPRVLGRYVREKKIFTLEEAIRKMTSLPASRLKLADRGTIAPGRKADLVLFNPDTVIDRSSFIEPRKLSVGIETVVVNGETVWEQGKATGARPGRVLTGAK